MIFQLGIVRSTSIYEKNYQKSSGPRALTSYNSVWKINIL